MPDQDTAGSMNLLKGPAAGLDTGSSLSQLAHPRAVFPQKLARGDALAVVAPSLSHALISDENRARARARWNEMGFTLRFGRFVEECDQSSSGSIASRVADVHEAFADPQVKGILTVLGGFNCNQLLPHLDYDLIARNPKVLCGYSDTTALLNAIYAKTGLVTYHGPYYSTAAMQRGAEYILEMFQRCLMTEGPFHIRAAKEWSDDAWYRDQTARTFFSNDGLSTLRPGCAEGRIVGGNLSTFALLHGTAYLPPLAGSVLFLEDDCESRAHHFDRCLQAVLQQPGFSEVRALVIGRFQRGSEISKDDLAQIVRGQSVLDRIPVVAGADFGHTTPFFTFPIGGSCRVQAEESAVELVITQH